MTTKVPDAQIIVIFSRCAFADNGFTYLGSGSSRKAYLGPDGWVYKVGHNYQCVKEVENAQRFYLESDSAVRFPWAEIVGYCDWGTIVRMEMVTGEKMPEDPWEPWKELERFVVGRTRTAIEDVHDDNVLFEDGTAVLLDLGC
jgi:hypothetical protein